MTRAEIITQTLSLTKQSQEQTEIIVAALFEVIIAALENGEPVAIPGFGVFEAKWRNQTIGRLINQNTTILVPGHYIPLFRPFRGFSIPSTYLESPNYETEQ